MPFCPECMAEYRAGIGRCADCAVDLIESLPNSKEEETDLELIELAEFPNYPEAEMIRELLEGNQISSVLRGQTDPIGAASGATPVTLLVERRDEERAREIYEDFFAGEGVPEEDEPAETP
jgi:hypothetical protein